LPQEIGNTGSLKKKKRKTTHHERKKHKTRN